MTLLDQPWSRSAPPARRGDRTPQRPQQDQQQPINVGGGERAVSVAAGSVLGLLALTRRGVPGLVAAAVGAAMIYRGVTGHCHLYDALGFDTAHPQDEDEEARRQEAVSRRGIHVEQAFLINRPADDLYRYWRNFENLPRIMTHLERVDVIDDRRSHWVAKAPRLVGGSVEWDAEITRDEPNTLIAWRSLAGADVDNAGEVRFAKALGDRGTEVHVSMNYVPPAGRLGDWLAKLLGSGAERQIREDLRNFKRTMEVGELPTITGQPRGTCTGRGARSTE